MSKTNEDDPVTEKLCEARRQTIQEQINGLKKTIYVTSSAITIVIVVVQFILTFYR
jgi:hypothetical protein